MVSCSLPFTVRDDLLHHLRMPGQTSRLCPMSFGFQFPTDRPQRVTLPAKVPDQDDCLLFGYIFDQASAVYQTIPERNVPARLLTFGPLIGHRRTSPFRY